jgi:hypothetical protein
LWTEVQKEFTGEICTECWVMIRPDFRNVF